MIHEDRDEDVQEMSEPLLQPQLEQEFATVVLRHERTNSDGGDDSHYDWMLATDAAGEQPLITFRLAVRPDQLAVNRRASLQRLGDHRPKYLTYEGDISENRGSVKQVTGGTARCTRIEPTRWTILVRWADDTADAEEQSFAVIFDFSAPCEVLRMA